MSDELNAFERLDADMPLPLDLRALEDRVIDDSLAWESIVPPADRLVEFARTLPTEGAPHADESPAGGPVARPGGAPERIRHRVASGRAPRRHALAAYAAAFGLMALTSLLLVQLASLRAVGTSVPPRQVEATATVGLADPTSTPPADRSPATTPEPTSSPTGQGSAAGSSGFAVTRAIVSVSPNTWESDICSPTMPFTLSVRFNASSAPAPEPIIFRWLRSDGYTSAPTTVPAADIAITPNTPPHSSIYDTTWDIPAATGDGSQKWVAVEVLSPGHFVTQHTDVSLTCHFGEISTSASVVNTTPGAGATGYSSSSYDCTLGGDQTLTFSGVISAYPGPGDHVVTYHWQRWDGSVGPDETVTIPAGATTANAVSDVLVVHQADPGSPGAMSEKIVTTSPASLVEYEAQYFKNC